MSFTAQVKHELATCPLTEKEADAELAAIVRICGTLSLSGRQQFRLEVATSTGSVARKAYQLLRECYNLRCELTVRRSILHKTHNYLITVPEQPVLPEALVLMGVLNDDLGLAREIEGNIVKTDACASSYLRGAFMAGGSLSEPHADAHFELVAQRLPLAQGLAALMGRLGVPASVSRRRSDFVIYLKSARDIIAFLRLVGAPEAAASFERARAVKSLRNDTNRLVNAELANQKKVSDAAAAQIQLIHAIDEQVGLAALPEALHDFCRLRLAHPELSLRELGEAAEPPLSKSAIGHRARRLEEYAVQLGLSPE